MKNKLIEKRQIEGGERDLGVMLLDFVLQTFDDFVRLAEFVCELL